MDLPREDILNYYQPLINLVKSFRGPKAYIVDTIKKVSSLPPKEYDYIKVNRVSDVAILLSDISLNRI